MSNIKVIRPQKGPQEKFLSTTADIAIYDLAGRQISYKTNVSTNNDHQLNLVAAGVYLVKISYKDGKVVTKKTINK